MLQKNLVSRKEMMMRQYYFNNLAKPCRNIAVFLFIILFAGVFTACRNNTTCLPLYWGSRGASDSGPGHVIVPTASWLVWDNDTWHKAWDEIDACTVPGAWHVIYLACSIDGSVGLPNNIHILAPNREVTDGRRVDIRRHNNVANNLVGGNTVATESRITVSDPGSKLVLDGPTLYRVRIFAYAETVVELRRGSIRDNINLGNTVHPQAAVNITGPDSRFYMFDGTINNNTAPMMTNLAAIANAQTSGGVNVTGTNTRFYMLGGTIGPGNIGTTGGGVRIAGGSAFNMFSGTITGNVAGGVSGFAAGGAAAIFVNSAGGGGGVYVTGAGSTFFMGEAPGEPLPIIAGNSTNGHGRFGGGVRITTNAQFMMNAGYIELNTTQATVPPGTGTGASEQSHGAGVFVHNGSTFTMNSGYIRNNTAAQGSGGGVVVYASTFIMGTPTTVPTISGNNSANRSGGGVFLNGGSMFNMINGLISENNAGGAGTEGGGGVNVTGGSTFNMHAGDIYNNSATMIGGGVRVWQNSAKFNMFGGTIEGNEAGTSGGGVLVNSFQIPVGFIPAVFTMFGGSIEGNEAGHNGGGIQVDTSGHFYMHPGAIIEYNTAGNFGGGINLIGNNLNARSIVTMHGGAIQNNIAGTRGGGLHMYGTGGYPAAHNTFYIKGGIIQGNSVGFNADGTISNAAGAGGGVYVRGGVNRLWMTGGVIMGYPSNRAANGLSHAFRRHTAGVSHFFGVTNPGTIDWAPTIDSVTHP